MAAGRRHELEPFQWTSRRGLALVNGLLFTPPSVFLRIACSALARFLSGTLICSWLSLCLWVDNGSGHAFEVSGTCIVPALRRRRGECSPEDVGAQDGVGTIVTRCVFDARVLIVLGDVRLLLPVDKELGPGSWLWLT